MSWSIVSARRPGEFSRGIFCCGVEERPSRRLECLRGCQHRLGIALEDASGVLSRGDEVLKGLGAADGTSSRLGAATNARGGCVVIEAAKLAIVIALRGAAVVYGADVFCALVQRPALAAVDDRALVAVMGNVHRYGDRRMPVPGVIGIAGAALGAGLAAGAGMRLEAIAAATAVARC